MCRSSANGGRRCPTSTSHTRRRAHDTAQPAVPRADIHPTEPDAAPPPPPRPEQTPQHQADPDTTRTQPGDRRDGTRQHGDRDDTPPGGYRITNTATGNATVRFQADVIGPARTPAEHDAWQAQRAARRAERDARRATRHDTDNQTDPAAARASNTAGDDDQFQVQIGHVGGAISRDGTDA